MLTFNYLLANLRINLETILGFKMIKYSNIILQYHVHMQKKHTEDKLELLMVLLPMLWLLQNVKINTIF